jgi:hypothetical protein
VVEARVPRGTLGDALGPFAAAPFCAPASAVRVTARDLQAARLRAGPVTGPGTAACFGWSADGSFTSSPEAGVDGSDRFACPASGGGQVSNAATATLSALGIDDPRVAIADGATAAEGSWRKTIQGRLDTAATWRSAAIRGSSADR